MENWIWTTINGHLNAKYTYHNGQHISSVLKHLTEMMDHYNLSRQERRLLKTAALFHDLAFIHSHLNHERESARMAAERLPEFGYSDREITLIQGMIMATRIPQSPVTFMEKLLCDADLFYLGGKNYFHIADKLRQEWENLGLLKGERHWLETQLNFLEAHHFHTDYARVLLKPGKQAVINTLKLELAENRSQP